MIQRERGAPETKRAAILEAAQKLFSQYGYRRTSIDDIAREAEIAKGTVYLSFKSKEQIFRALCENLAERVVTDAAAAASLDGPLENRLRAILEAKYGLYFELVKRSPHAAELMDSKNRLSADLFIPSDKKYARILRETIDTAMNRGDIAAGELGLDGAALAELLMASASGIEKSVTQPAILHRRLKELTRLACAALAPRTPAGETK
jgi:TetR/AcrR family transcriptional regulator, regulator of autoinduction and epiphytic fitness